MSSVRNAPVATLIPMPQERFGWIRWVKLGTWAFCAFQVFLITAITMVGGKSSSPWQPLYDAVMGIFMATATMAWWTAVNKGIDEVFRK